MVLLLLHDQITILLFMIIASSNGPSHTMLLLFLHSVRQPWLNHIYCSVCSTYCLLLQHIVSHVCANLESAIATPIRIFVLFMVVWNWNCCLFLRNVCFSDDLCTFVNCSKLISCVVIFHSNWGVTSLVVPPCFLWIELAFEKRSGIRATLIVGPRV